MVVCFSRPKIVIFEGAGGLDAKKYLVGEDSYRVCDLLSIRIFGTVRSDMWNKGFQWKI
jgi:hypothetical protein